MDDGIKMVLGRHPVTGLVRVIITDAAQDRSVEFQLTDDNATGLADQLTSIVSEPLTPTNAPSTTSPAISTRDGDMARRM